MLNKNLELIITFGIFALLVGPSSALDCSNVVVKENEGVLNWLGNVTFTVPVTTDPAIGWEMWAEFDYQYTGIGVWIVWTSQVEPTQQKFWNREENAQLIAGQRFSFRFRINYGTNVPQPQLISLKFGDTELCRN